MKKEKRNKSETNKHYLSIHPTHIVLLFKDKAEFRRVFLEFYNPLCNYANNMLRDENTAEDIIQDVFLKLWERNDDLSYNHTLKSYLFLAVKNKVLEYFRSKKSYNKAVENSGVAEQLSAGHDEMAEVYTGLERLSGLMRHLPSKCRDVFVLHKFKGLTYTEIAKEKNIAKKTVENHMLRAIKILREHSIKKKS